jgi:pimeloyl-ACP methyl ester carboxylesterase
MHTSLAPHAFTVKRLALALFALLLCGLVLAYYGAPQHFKKPLLQLNRTVAGLTAHTITTEDHTLHYLDGGSGPTLVLLHGIFAEKDHWVDFARPLTAHYRVLAPDLPGFGESTRLPIHDYGYSMQVEKLKDFLDQMGVQKAHLAGNSLGGTVAVLFALRYPERVASVALVGAPHGLRTPQPSEMDALIDAGKSPLVVTHPEAFEPMLDFVFAQRPLLPYPILHAAKEDALRNAASNTRIWNAQRNDRYLLDTRIDALKHPTLVLWGEKDRLFDVSGAAMLRQRLPHAQVHVLPGVGHLPMMETPKASAAQYAEFLGGLQ